MGYGVKGPCPKFEPAVCLAWHDCEQLPQKLDVVVAPCEKAGHVSCRPAGWEATHVTYCEIVNNKAGDAKLREPR